MNIEIWHYKYSMHLWNIQLKTHFTPKLKIYKSSLKSCTKFATSALIVKNVRTFTRVSSAQVWQPVEFHRLWGWLREGWQNLWYAKILPKGLRKSIFVFNLCVHYFILPLIRPFQGHLDKSSDPRLDFACSSVLSDILPLAKITQSKQEIAQLLL